MSYEDTLYRIATEDLRIIVMTAENRAVIRGLPGKLGPRFIDVGVAEQTLVGMAAGLALAGRIVVAHALAPFLTMRAFEFIRTDVGIGALPVKLVGFIPGILSDANGPTHQALEDIALMRGIPGMKVFCPADVAELVQALPELIHDPAPCYVRYPAVSGDRSGAELPVAGRAEVLATGSDVTLLAFGALLPRARQARDALRAAGLSTGLINLRWLAPIDEHAIVRAAKQAKYVVTIEDHFIAHGLYSMVSEILQRHAVRARLIPIGMDGRWFSPGELDAVLEQEGLSGPKLALRIQRAITQKEQ